MALHHSELSHGDSYPGRQGRSSFDGVDDMSHQPDTVTPLDAQAEGYVLPSTSDVYLDHLAIDRESNEIVRHMVVEDPYFEKLKKWASPEDFARICADRQNFQSAWDDIEAVLRAAQTDEEIAGARKLAHEAVFGQEDDPDPAMKAWGDLMPSAEALGSLYRPEVPYVNGARVTRNAWERFAFSVDGEAIRTRARLAQELVADYVRKAAQSGRTRIDLASIACGAAEPVLGFMDVIKTELPGMDVHASAFDWDEKALRQATERAAEFGIDATHFTVQQMNILRAIVNPNLLREKMEQAPDIIDLLGIFEYFDEATAAKLLRMAYDLLPEGGMLIFANMTKSHPQLEMNQHGVGWPKIKPRTVAEIKAIVERAGLDMADAATFIPQDNVYAVVRMIKREKPAANSDTNQELADVIDLDSRRRDVGIAAIGFADNEAA